MIATLIHCALLAPRTWTLAVGGDIMLNGIDPRTNPFVGIQSLFQTADIAYANLEIPITNSRTATSKKTPAELKARTQFILKASPKHAQWLALLGLDFVSLANNHAMDYGWAGLQEMQGLLKSKGIQWVGAGGNKTAADQLAIETLPNGLKVGLLSYLAFVSAPALNKCTPATETNPGIAVLNFGGVPDEKWINERVRACRSKVDVLLVALHWGLEKQPMPTSYQKALGRAFITAGADAVLGAHPHVIQAKEIYKKAPIFYSLGNFISPTPAVTSVYRLTFSERRIVRIDETPCSIYQGKIVMMKDGSKVKDYHSKLDEKLKNEARKRPN